MPLPVDHSRTNQDCYRVELQAGQVGCMCDQCLLWTIVYDDGGPTEIGTSWQGPDGKESAEDVCDLMNMAYWRGYQSCPTT